jgi:hypothetical protein
LSVRNQPSFALSDLFDAGHTRIPNNPRLRSHISYV